MSRDEIQNIVVMVFSTILKQGIEDRADISRDNTDAWDSLKHMEVFFALEDELGIEFSDAELLALDSVGKIVDCVEAKHAA